MKIIIDVDTVSEFKDIVKLRKRRSRGVPINLSGLATQSPIFLIGDFTKKTPHFPR